MVCFLLSEVIVVSRWAPDLYQKNHTIRGLVFQRAHPGGRGGTATAATEPGWECWDGPARNTAGDPTLRGCVALCIGLPNLLEQFAHGDAIGDLTGTHGLVHRDQV